MECLWDNQCRPLRGEGIALRCNKDKLIRPKDFIQRADRVNLRGQPAYQSGPVRVEQKPDVLC
jgi:hypothetical protein